MEKKLLNEYVKELEELKAQKEEEKEEDENENDGRFFPDFRNFLK